jgi:starch-binding outer membrane protein, SusD/RagB family
MRSVYKLSFFALLLISFGCRKLDRYPLDSPSTATFYQTKAEMDLAITGLYASSLYSVDDDAWTDNFWDRTAVGNEMIHGTSTIQSSEYYNLWYNCYKAIERANLIIDNISQTQGVTDAYKSQALAQARFVRGWNYCMLSTHFGAVPLVQHSLTIDQSKTFPRTPQADIVTFAFADLDYAASVLPVSYTGQQFFTKGAALGVKARSALYLGQYQIAADAAQQIMNLGVYNLYAKYSDIFLKAGEHSSEVMISFPRSATYNSYYSIQYYMSRNAGGYASSLPTYELLDAYECTDGKTIDQSSLYDPKMPFNNRDPRLKMTIVTPGTDFLGYDYEYYPDSTTCKNYITNKKVANNDCKTVNLYASYNGLLWKKSIDSSQLVNYNKVDLDEIIMRYAEVLLTYAEAKIELGSIDQSVLDAINKVRARAYGVAYTQTTAYPAITTTSQTDLRTIIRRERRVEFPKEGLRYMDIIRWKLAEKVLNVPVLGLPKAKADYYFPGTPVISSDTYIDQSAFAAKLTTLDQRSFNPSKHYIWPVPYAELVQDPSLGQNLGW